jgi:hypothetical protein
MKNKGCREAGKCSKMVSDVAIDVCLFFNFIVAFYTICFPFLLVKTN